MPSTGKASTMFEKTKWVIPRVEKFYQTMGQVEENKLGHYSIFYKNMIMYMCINKGIKTQHHVLNITTLQPTGYIYIYKMYKNGPMLGWGTLHLATSLLPSSEGRYSTNGDPNASSPPPPATSTAPVSMSQVYAGSAPSCPLCGPLGLSECKCVPLHLLCYHFSS